MTGNGDSGEREKMLADLDELARVHECDDDGLCLTCRTEYPCDNRETIDLARDRLSSGDAGAAA